MITSAPPSDGSRKGPPSESQYRVALSLIQSVMLFLSLADIRSSGFATPWRILWTFLVIRNTPGLGLGTYLCVYELEMNERQEFISYQVKSTPITLAKRTRACLMSATPPP
jgi:hypothetical protein